MTKEPSKDFRQAVMDIIADAECNLDAPSEKQLTTDEFTDRILALCKEMLVPDRIGKKPYYLNTSWKGYTTYKASYAIGWNACMDYFLNQLVSEQE